MYTCKGISICIFFFLSFFLCLLSWAQSEKRIYWKCVNAEKKKFVNTIIALSPTFMCVHTLIRYECLCVCVLIWNEENDNQNRQFSPCEYRAFPSLFLENMLENEFIIISHTYHKRHFNDIHNVPVSYFPGCLILLVDVSVSLLFILSFCCMNAMPFWALNKLSNWNHFSGLHTHNEFAGHRITVLFWCHCILNGFCLMWYIFISENILDWNVEYLRAKSRKTYSFASQVVSLLIHYSSIWVLHFYLLVSFAFNSQWMQFTKRMEKRERECENEKTKNKFIIKYIYSVLAFSLNTLFLSLSFFLCYGVRVSTCTIIHISSVYGMLSIQSRNMNMSSK